MSDVQKPRSTPPGAEELRALRARVQIPLYQIAPRVGLHPARLGRMLNEKEYLPPKIARRVARLLGGKEAMP